MITTSSPARLQSQGKAPWGRGCNNNNNNYYYYYYYL